jgi:hypothetical protein
MTPSTQYWAVTAFRDIEAGAVSPQAGKVTVHDESVGSAAETSGDR